MPDLASALLKLADSISGPKTSSRWTKVHEPDTFDGSDAWKLQPFIVQCTLNFCDRPDPFSSDSAKVNFALCYSKGTALNWFKPGLTSMDPPDWLDSYSNFLSKLKSNFGPHNPEGEAKAELENLQMCNNQQITKYTVEFNRLAVRVRWGPATLQRQYYNRLLARIKDAFMITGRPDSLLDLKNCSHLIDDRYWECRSEQVRKARAHDRSSVKGKSSNSSSNSGNHFSNTNSGNSNSSNNKSDKKKSSNNSGRSGTPGSSGNSGSSNNNSRSTSKTPDLSTKLGKDGKLTQQERQC